MNDHAKSQRNIPIHLLALPTVSPGSVILGVSSTALHSASKKLYKFQSRNNEKIKFKSLEKKTLADYPKHV